MNQAIKKISGVKPSNLKSINIGFFIFLILSLSFGTGKNNIELIVSWATIAFITNLFLTKQPVIFFTIAYHTIQATIKVFYAEFNNLALEDLGNYSAKANLSSALILSCVGIAMLSFSIYIFLPKEYIKTTKNFNIKRLFIAYLCFVLLELLAASIGQLGGLFQIIYKISGLKWGILFLIIYQSIKQKKPYFLIIIAYEIIINILSYFSTFKNSLFITIISLIIVHFHFFKIKSRNFIFFGTLSLALMFGWQLIKADYRQFLSGDEQGQNVTVDFEDAYDKIFDLVEENSFTNSNVIDNTVDRLSYIDLFAESINYVPNEQPHTNGKLWLESVLHILQPRLFFPDKKAIDDSQKTMEYTGLLLAGSSQGTSISLGYIAESYIDFGTYLFVIPLILLGLFIGWLFRKLYESGIDTIYFWALSIPFYFQFYGLEMATEKIIGSIVLYSLIVLILVKYFRNKLSWLES